MKKTINCLTCGNEFSSYNPNPRFCSKECKSESQRDIFSHDEMIRLYELGHTQEEVAEMLGTTQKVIYKRMKLLGYKPRVAVKRNQIGEKNDNWKGGRVDRTDGYIYKKRVGHPRATKSGDYVLEHILVVEEYIGRYLFDDEVVHHINGVKNENRLENLYLTTQSEHMKMHNIKVAHLVTSNLDEFKER